MAAAVVGAAPAIVSGYERLRRCALGVSVDGLAEPGLALLMRRGLRAWIEARGDAADATPAPPPSDGSTTTPLGPHVRGELVRLVATMALDVAQQEACI
jgi:hypothetical protein